MGSISAYRGLPVKAVAVSAAVLSTAVMLHFSGPSLLRFASSEIPKMYASLISWLTPPYIYFIINGIILSIAASSMFHHPAGSDDPAPGSGSGSGSAPVVTNQQYIVVAAPPPTVEEEVKVAYDVPADYETAAEERKAEEKEDDDEEFVISRSSWDPKRIDTTATEKVAEAEIPAEYSILTEKPMVYASLGRRKSLKKASPEAGKALGVARPKRNDTLESTWKAITDGRAVPLTRHLKKSDTCSRASRDDPKPEPTMRKFETFNERGCGGASARRPPASSSPSPGARLRREPSVGQDDLNRRVEAFINKFNEEMRLQRQESFKHYSDMINRGSH